MKVSLAISDLSVRGGTHKQVLRLAQYLARSGDEVEILTSEYLPDKCYPEFENFIVKTNAMEGQAVGRGRSADRILRGIRLAERISPDSDLLNIHDLSCEWMALAAMLCRKHLPIVWQINDLHPAFRVGPSRTVKRYWTHPIHRYITRRIARHAKAVTVNVTKNADRVREHIGVQPEVFYCGVDQMTPYPILRELRPCIQLVSIGVMMRYRNYESILAAMGSLRNQGVDCQLTIIGSTKYDPQYASQLSRIANDSGVKLEIAGEVGEEKLRSILKAAHVFVFVNVDQSWGLAVFEAMTMSLPVVLSNSVGAVELLKDSKGVLLVDPRNPAEIAEAVCKLTATESTYQQFASAAFGDAADCTWDQMYCSKMRLLFQNVIAATREEQNAKSRL